MRNRERVLEAAKAVFSAGGPDASLEAVAQDAPASASARSIATSRRARPCSRRSIGARCSSSANWRKQLKSEADPVDALRRWLRSNVEFVATKKGMLAALALAVHGSSELTAFSFDRLTKAVGALLDRAVAAGEIRADISPEDLLRALVGMCYMHDQPGWQNSVLRLLDVFVDGLRVRAEADGQATRASQRDAAAESIKEKRPRRGSPRTASKDQAAQIARTLNPNFDSTRICLTTAKIRIIPRP